MIKLPDIATQASGSMACPASSMNAWLKCFSGIPAETSRPAVMSVTTTTLNQIRTKLWQIVRDKVVILKIEYIIVDKTIPNQF